MNNVNSNNTVALNICSNAFFDFLLQIANKKQSVDYVFEVMVGRGTDSSFMFYNKIVFENPFVEYRIFNGNYIFSIVDSNGSLFTIPTISNVSFKTIDNKTNTNNLDETVYIDFITNHFGNDVDVKIKIKKKIE